MKIHAKTIVYLLHILPLFAIAIAWQAFVIGQPHQKAQSRSEAVRCPSAKYPGSNGHRVQNGTVIHVRHGYTKHRKPHSKMNAVAYLHYEHTSFGSTPFNVGVASNDALGYLYDGNTATGYPMVSTAAQGIASVGIIDLGASVAVGGVTPTWTWSGSVSSVGGTCYTSNDGTTWTNQGALTSGIKKTFSTTARYIEVIVVANATAAGQSVTLVELYGWDGSGTIIGGPGAPPPPLQRTLYYKTTSISPPTNPSLGLFLDAPLLRDNIRNDLLTGYEQIPSSPSDTCVVYGVIDIGTPAAIGSAEISWRKGVGQLWDLFRSLDGQVWTPIVTGGDASSVNTVTPNVLASCQFVMCRIYGPQPTKLTDFRLSTDDGTEFPVLVSFMDSLAGVDSNGSGALTAISFTDSVSGSDAITKTVSRPSWQQGTTDAMASLGTASVPVLPGTWQINWGSIKVADNFTPGNWLATWDGTNITVTIPIDALVTLGSASFYTAYYTATAGAAPVYVQFDVITGSVTFKAFTDSGAGSDSMSGSGQLVAFFETCFGVDAIGLSAAIAFADGATGSDSAAAPTNPLAYADTGAGADMITVGYSQEFWDRARSGELLTVDAAGTVTSYALLADYGVGVDAVTVAVAVSFTDSATAVDAVAPVAAAIDFAESATGSDVFTVPTKFDPGACQVFLD